MILTHRSQSNHIVHTRPIIKKQHPHQSHSTTTSALAIEIPIFTHHPLATKIPVFTHHLVATKIQVFTHQL